MIKSFRCPDTERLFKRQPVWRYRAFQEQARRKLNMLNAAKSLIDLQMLPGNQLVALKGDRKGQYSIRINQQWRICFIWRDGDALSVEIVDYH